MCIADGMTSLLDCPRFTSSLGCAPASRPITSLAFMLVEVPLPVWKMSTTNSESCLPSMTRLAAASTASSRIGDSRRPS